MKHLNDISEFKQGPEKLLAPNGKVSNLSPELYNKVRTAEFKRWFGDWENDPESASKVVDENGEPLVVYHGTPSHGFTEFLNTYDLPRATANETNNIGVWFVSDKNTADRFMFGSAKGGIYEVFLNIRNPKVFKPKVLNRFEIDRLEDLYQELERKKNRAGFGKLSDMTAKEREEYAKYDKEAQKVRKQISLLKSADSFEQFMNHRDKYAEYIDGVKGEIGHWMRRMINTNKNEANKKLVQEFRQDQHDGIIIAATQYDAVGDGTVNQYIVFDSQNIKAVDNVQFNANSSNIHESEKIYKDMTNESHTNRFMIGDFELADQIKKMFAEMLADQFDIDSPVRIREISSHLNDIAFDMRTFTVETEGEAITAIAKMAETSEKDVAAAIERLLNSYDYLLESDGKWKSARTIGFKSKKQAEDRASLMKEQNHIYRNVRLDKDSNNNWVVKFEQLNESVKNEDAVKAARSNVEKRRIMDFKTFIKADENANSVEKTEHDIVKKSYSGEKRDKKGYATLSESELMGGQPNSKPMPSGYSLVSDKGYEIIVQDEDGKKEVWVKNNGVASYRLLHKGNEYEFAHSVDEADNGDKSIKTFTVPTLLRIYVVYDKNNKAVAMWKDMEDAKRARNRVDGTIKMAQMDRKLWNSNKIDLSNINKYIIEEYE